MIAGMKYVQLHSLRDMVMLMVASPSANAIQHLETGGGHVYFIIGGTLSETFIYFVREERALAGRFIAYNSYTGEISFSERVKTEPNVSSIPIVDIRDQNILPEEVLARVGSP